jgi:hypothetical protein
MNGMESKPKFGEDIPLTIGHIKNSQSGRCLETSRSICHPIGVNLGNQIEHSKLSISRNT